MNEVRNGNKTLEWDFSRPIQNGPTTRGFDSYFGVPYSNDMQPSILMRMGEVIEQPARRGDDDVGTTAKAF